MAHRIGAPFFIISLFIKQSPVLSIWLQSQRHFSSRVLRNILTSILSNSHT